MSQSLTRVPRSSPDTVAALEQLLHHPRADEAAGAGHAHQLLLLTAVGLGRHGDPAQQVPMLKLLVECVWNGSVSVSDSQCVFVPRSLTLCYPSTDVVLCGDPGTYGSSPYLYREAVSQRERGRGWGRRNCDRLRAKHRDSSSSPLLIQRRGASSRRRGARRVSVSENSGAWEPRGERAQMRSLFGWLVRFVAGS